MAAALGQEQILGPLRIPAQREMLSRGKSDAQIRSQNRISCIHYAIGTS